MAQPSKLPKARVAIRRMTAADVARVAELHAVAFPGFFMSYLGPRFLQEFYAAAVEAREIVLVAGAGGGVVGFVMGSANPGGVLSRLLRTRLLSFAFAAAPAVVRSPSIALRAARTLTKARHAAPPEGTATLMSLSVDPTAQGLGAGKALVTAFIDEAKRRGSTRVDLTTDRMENEKANAFYRGLGFRFARQVVTPGKRVLNEYEIDCPAPDARSAPL